MSADKSTVQLLPQFRPQNEATFEKVVLSRIKPFGLFQILFGFSMQWFNVAMAGNFALMVFGNIQPTWICSDDDQFQLLLNDSRVDACAVFDTCTNLTYHTQFRSLAQDFVLVCERKYYVSLLSSVQMVGYLFGTQLVGLFADRFGRRTTACSSFLALCAVGLLGSWCWDPISMGVCLFLIGAGVAASLWSYIVWIMESTDSSNNGYMTASGMWQFSYMIAALVAYTTRDWRVYLRIMNGCCILAPIIYWFVLPESPRWLIQKGRLAEATRAIETMAKVNFSRRNYKEFCLDEDSLQELKYVTDVEQKKHKNYVDLFRNSRLRINGLLVLFFGLNNSLLDSVYTLSFGSFHAGPFLNMFAYALIRVYVPALAVSMDRFPLLKRLKRRHVFIFFYVVVMVLGALVILCCICSWDSAVMNVLGMATAVAAGPLWLLVFSLSAELFPTELRCAAAGLAGLGASIGSFTGPQVLYLETVWNALPFLIVEVVCACMFTFGFCCIAETRGKDLPENRAGGMQRACDDAVEQNENLVVAA